MISAVIPTLYHPPQLGRLLEVLEEDEVEVHLLESESFGHRIYVGWNAGVRKSTGDFIAILNDDIEILPGTLPMMAAVLAAQPRVGVVYPDQSAPLSGGIPDRVQIQLTEGSGRVGGMTGFCFMFRSDLGVPFDERYNWWYGDDQFDLDVRLKGLTIGRVNGLPISHAQSTSASKRQGELDPLIRSDSLLWLQERR